MRIVGGLDIHRRQITFDYLDERSGQCRRGRIAPADRMLLRHWLKTTLDGAPAAFAVEACTGWRFVVEELRRAGSRHIWPSRPIPRPRAGRSGGRRPTAPTLGICASCLPAGGYRSRGSRRNRWGRCAPGCSCSGTCARSAPPGCSAFTRSCCTKAPRRSPVTCSARTTGVGSRRPRTCHRPASRRSRLHADRRCPGRRARGAAAADRRVCSPPARL